MFFFDRKSGFFKFFFEVPRALLLRVLRIESPEGMENEALDESYPNPECFRVGVYIDTFFYDLSFHNKM